MSSKVPLYALGIAVKVRLGGQEAVNTQEGEESLAPFATGSPVMPGEDIVGLECPCGPEGPSHATLESAVAAARDAVIDEFHLL